MALRRGWGVAPALMALLLGVSACSDAPDESERWPLSEIEQPDSAAQHLAASDSTGEATAAADSTTAVAEAPPARREPAPARPGEPAPRPYRAPPRVTVLPAEPGGQAEPTGPASVDGMTSAVEPEAGAEPVVDPVPDPESDPESDTALAGPAPRFPRPEHVRGLYLNAWAAGSSNRVAELLEIAATTEINTFVIDIKDATGYVSHRTGLELAREIGADGEIRIRDLPGLLDRLEDAGIYPIARIVVVKDPILAAARPETAIQDTAGGVWIDSKDIIWQNLFNEDVWRYNVELAKEVAGLGFPEIQWDYIRFPDAPASDMERAVFAGGEGKLRVDAVRGFLSYAREELDAIGVESTADVFGVTTSFNRDVGIGQLWETFIDVVDAALPMVYPSHYWPHSFGYAAPNAYPYEIVHEALRRALNRSRAVDGAGKTTPWLQDFSLGAPPYGAAEVRAQIQAAYDVGIHDWILWNPSVRYSRAALEPVGGFEQEPLIRVAGVLAPVSRRWEVMDSVEVAERIAFEAAAAARAAAEAEAEANQEATAPTGGAEATDSVEPTDSVAPLDSAGPADSATSAGAVRPDSVGRGDSPIRTDSVLRGDSVVGADSVVRGDSPGRADSVLPVVEPAPADSTAVVADSVAPVDSTGAPGRR